MSRSKRKVHIFKRKDRFFQKYANRAERRRTKEDLLHRRLSSAEGLHIPRHAYDVIDQTVIEAKFKEEHTAQELRRMFQK